MDATINVLIASLNKEEARHFKLNAQKYIVTSEERKDISLFDYIRKSNENYNEEKIVLGLYGTDDKNSFYRLRNRLLEEVNKSLLILHYNTSDYHFILNHIILCRLFQSKRNFSLAYFYLRKAEKKAISIQANDLLDLVYAEAIRISNESLEINPEDYIKKRKENRALLIRLQEIDDILAVLIYRIKVSQNFTSGKSEILTLLSNTISEYTEHKETRENPVFRMKVYQAVSRILLQQHDYLSLEKYLLKTYTEFSREKLFNKNNHDTKLQMLTYLANSMFKNSKHTESITYASKLREAMDEFNSSLKEKYLFYYYNILVNNYGEIDKRKAVDTLLEAQEVKEITKNKFNQSFIYLQLALQYFDLGEFRSSNKNMVKVKLEDNFKIFDSAFQLKIAVVELIVRYELEDLDFIEIQIPKIKKEYSDLLSDESYSRQLLMLEILKKLIAKESSQREKQLQQLTQKIFAILDEKESHDNDLINYNEWLRKNYKAPKNVKN